MKKLLKISKCAFLSITIGAALVSCSNEQSKMKSQIKAYLEKNAKDPKSYEFVELSIVDTVTLGDVAKGKILDISSKIAEAQTAILENQIAVLENKASYRPESYDEINKSREKSIETYKSFIEVYKKDSLKLASKTNADKVVGYIAKHSYRLKNGYGALDLSQSFIAFDLAFNLLNFSDQKNYASFKLE